jgi:hypothetical protein
MAFIWRTTEVTSLRNATLFGSAKTLRTLELPAETAFACRQGKGDVFLEFWKRMVSSFNADSMTGRRSASREDILHIIGPLALFLLYGLAFSRGERRIPQLTPPSCSLSLRTLASTSSPQAGIYSISREGHFRPTETSIAHREAGVGNSFQRFSSGQRSFASFDVQLGSLARASPRRGPPNGGKFQ